MVMRKKNLFKALLNFFSKSDAFLLAELLEKNLHKEMIRFDEI